MNSTQQGTYRVVRMLGRVFVEVDETTVTRSLVYLDGANDRFVGDFSEALRAAKVMLASQSDGATIKADSAGAEDPPQDAASASSAQSLASPAAVGSVEQTEADRTCVRREVADVLIRSAAEMAPDALHAQAMLILAAALIREGGPRC